MISTLTAYRNLHQFPLFVDRLEQISVGLELWDQLFDELLCVHDHYPMVTMIAVIDYGVHPTNPSLTNCECYADFLIQCLPGPAYVPESVP